jgi:hypothetical protein
LMPRKVMQYCQRFFPGNRAPVGRPRSIAFLSVNNRGVVAVRGDGGGAEGGIGGGLAE